MLDPASFTHVLAAFGYHGDTVVNSFGDVLACGLGFALVRRLGFYPALAVFALTEAVLAVWVRYGLLLNGLMPVYPIEALEAWQTDRR